MRGVPFHDIERHLAEVREMKVYILYYLKTPSRAWRWEFSFDMLDDS